MKNSDINIIANKNRNVNTSRNINVDMNVYPLKKNIWRLKFYWGSIRVFAIFVFLLVVLLWVFAGCGETKYDDKTHLEFWTISLRPTYNDYMFDLIDKYEKKHPHIKIDWVDVPIDVAMQKLMASIAGGVSPDVVNLNTSYSQILAQNKALLSMDKTVPQEKKELYFPGLWKAAEFEGENYAIPWYVTTRVVMYNKEIFEKAGLDPLKPPSTWEEVESMGREITQKTGKYGYMPQIKLVEDFYVRGVPVVNEERNKALFNCGLGVEVLDFYLRMQNEGIMPKETLMEGYQGAMNRYQSGELGMIIAGPTLLLKIQKDAPDIYKNTGVGAMPLGKAGIVPASTMNLVIPRASKHKEQALDFALFVTNDENQLNFCKKAPLLPSTVKASQDEFFQKGYPDPLMGEAIKISSQQLPLAKDLNVSLKNPQDLNRAIKECLESTLYGRKTPQQALSDTAQEWDSILNTP